MKKYDKNYFVPVVVKNKDRLIGFLDTIDMLRDIGMSNQDLPWPLDSSRFNDILPGGARASDLSDDQLQELLDNQIEKHTIKEIVPGKEETVKPGMKIVINDEEFDVPDNSEERYLEINCECGNYYAFDHHEQIPHKNLVCDLCNRTLIDYIHCEDEEFDFDGVEVDYVDEDDSDEKDFD